MHDLGPAARETSRVVAQVSEDDLDRPTPCGEWTVRDLLGHVLAMSRHMAGVARHEPASRGGPPAELPADWPGELHRGVADLPVAWSEPAAWEGEGSAGGLTMPRADLGIVTLHELVLHGWDLAASIGAGYEVRDDDLAAVGRFVAGFEHAAQEARTGLYGPVVDTPVHTELDRVLALAGRDPQHPLPVTSA